MRFLFVLLRGLFLLSFVLSFLTGPIGCGTLKHPGFPEQSYNEDDELEELQKVLNTTKMIKEYYRGGNPEEIEVIENPSETLEIEPTGEIEVEPAGEINEVEIPGQTAQNVAPRRTTAKRNEIITARLLLIDKFYNRFIGDFSKEKQGLDTLVDVVTIGVDLAVATVGGASAKAALGAASAGLTGSKLSFDKNFYFEKTVSVLITSMNAARKVALLPIKKGSKLSLEEYSLGDAISDLHSYYFAGTFVGGLEAINQDAGVKANKATEDLAEIRTTDYLDDKWGRALQTYWMSGPPDNPVVIDKHQTILEDWMNKNGLKDVPLQIFITGGEAFAKLRKKAVQDLNIPVNQ